MARKNSTARFVETVKVDIRTDYWDDLIRGLVLRVSPGGVKSWTVIYTRESDGSRQRVTIGKFPAMTLEKARSRALASLTAVSNGEDPAGKKKARRAAMTLRELGGLYIERHAKREKRTWAEDQRILEVDVYPSIGNMKAMAATRRDVLDVIEAKADAGRVGQSRKVLAVVRKMLNWAVDNDFLAASPLAGVRPMGKPGKRERVLKDKEIASVLKALDGADLLPITRDIIRLLFLTGQRSGEVCGIRRNEIDVPASLWTIPGARTKNGLAQEVPLSPAALAIIEAADERADEEPDAPYFSRVGKPVASGSISHAVIKKLQVLDQPWTPHDIRRTVATGMGGIGIQPHIVEAVLNHISGFKGGVAGIYNRAQYAPEKRQALEAWANYLSEVESGQARGNVLGLSRARAEQAVADMAG